MASATLSGWQACTKTFVATIVLQLVDEGRVDLDETLSTYLPDTPVGGDVTIRDLLRHRSGLTNYTESTTSSNDIVADRARAFTPTSARLHRRLPAGEPGPVRLFEHQLHSARASSSSSSRPRTWARCWDRISGPLGLDVTHLAMAGEPPIEGLAGGWYPGVVDGDPAAAYDSITSGGVGRRSGRVHGSELRTFLDALLGGELISDDGLGQDDHQRSRRLRARPRDLGPRVRHSPATATRETLRLSQLHGDRAEHGRHAIVLTNNTELTALRTRGADTRRLVMADLAGDPHEASRVIDASLMPFSRGNHGRPGGGSMSPFGCRLARSTVLSWRSRRSSRDRRLPAPGEREEERQHLSSPQTYVEASDDRAHDLTIAGVEMPVRARRLQAAGRRSVRASCSRVSLGEAGPLELAASVQVAAAR